MNDLTNIGGQAWSVPELNDLAAQNNLAAQVNLFLLCGKVDGLSPFTLSGYKTLLGVFLRYCTTAKITTPAEIKRNHMLVFINTLQQNRKPKTVQDYYKTLHRFFNWLVEQEIIEVSPMVHMRTPRVPKTIIVPFRTEHIKDMLTLCDSNTFIGIRNRAIISVAIDTGLRLSELANITLPDIDMERELIKVMGKGAKERVVRIGRDAQKALLKYLIARRDSTLKELWLTEEKKPLHSKGIQEIMRRLKRQAGFTDVRCSMHTFRHTFATNALRNKADLQDVRLLLGHSTLTMTLKYAATISPEEAAERHKKFSPLDNLDLK